MKYLTPEELSSLVATLLIKPELLGCFDESGQHAKFMKDIGEAVANHCGGEVATITHGKDNQANRLAVAPNDCLPSFYQNVWSPFDVMGWEFMDIADWCKGASNLEIGEQYSPEQIKSLRVKMRSLIAPSSDVRYEYKHKMVDWRVVEGTPVETAGDDVPYVVTTRLGNQPSIEMYPETEEQPTFGFICEVNHGVPALHVDLGGDSILHIHATSDGLVILPDSGSRFQYAPPSRHSYNDPNALIVSQ